MRTPSRPQAPLAVAIAVAIANGPGSARAGGLPWAESHAGRGQKRGMNDEG